MRNKENIGHIVLCKRAIINVRWSVSKQVAKPK